MNIKTISNSKHIESFFVAFRSLLEKVRNKIFIRNFKKQTTPTKTSSSVKQIFPFQKTFMSPESHFTVNFLIVRDEYRIDPSKIVQDALKTLMTVENRKRASSSK